MSEKLKKRIYFSILISLLLHLGFLIWSIFVRVVPYGYWADKPKNVIHVKIAREESVGDQTTSSSANSSEKPVELDNPFEETKLMEPVTPTENVKDNFDSAIKRTDEVPVLTASKDAQTLTQPQMNDVTISKKVRRATRKNLVEVGELPQADFTSGAPVIDSGKDISKDFLDKSNLAMNTTAQTPVQVVASGASQLQAMKKQGGGLSRMAQAADLGTNLTYELSKYQDPKTGVKYFKLLVKVRDATLNFAVIPKEIIFLVDASQSIGKPRLKQFEQGLVHSLKNLNPSDRFNMIIFKDKTIAFSPTSVSPDIANLKKAITFLDNLQSGQRTDVYNALQTSINLQDNFVPSYRLLMSDGYPTTGMVNARQIINEVSKINNNRVSIFAFGGGTDISRYMMEFVAYKNRGWAQFTGREYLIGREVSKLYDRIRDPLLLNLRYRVSGIGDKEIYPKIMPDFFKGSEFVIYGTYIDEDQFFVQVLGNVLGETKAFIVSAALSQAAEGKQEIAHDWAFHKIYYLISQLKYNESNEELIKQIESLGTQFDIVTPYSRNAQDTAKPPATPKPPKIKKEPKPKNDKKSDASPAPPQVNPPAIAIPSTEKFQ